MPNGALEQMWARDAALGIDPRRFEPAFLVVRESGHVERVARQDAESLRPEPARPRWKREQMRSAPRRTR